ncbi:hypothetical protein EDD86DRAFT_150865 [Gorgonomyces haynaldii]|nr:hypothetical protein EDD86DRAFT_150865 [Gorgonomyces haynaldii]
MLVYQLKLAHFLFLDNLHQFLSQKNTGIYANLNATHPNALSSALIVSQSALQELVNRKVEFIGCVESTDPESSVDTLLHTCLFNLALKITVPQEMHCNDPLSWDQWPFRPCGRPLAISYRTERLKRSINAMNATYADLFQFYQPRSLNTKRTSVDGKMMASIDQCRMECDRDQRCLSWSFSKGVCFMNPDIPGSEFVPNAVSGLCKARYTCSKDTNRPCQPIGHFDRERIKARGESISKRRWH